MLAARRRDVQLEGSLSQFPLRELIEMAVYSSVSGVLEVQVGADVGRIFFRDGLPQHAELSALQGIDAIGCMFAEHDALFRFLADNAPVTPTLWMDPWEIIDLAEHQAQTWTTVRPYVSALGAIPTLRMPVQRAQSLVGADLNPLLKMIDGQRSIPDIARDLEVAPIDVYVGIATLIQQKIVTLTQPQPPAGSTGDSQTNIGIGDREEKREGFFERLIARALEEERRKSEPRQSEPRQSDPHISDPRRSGGRFSKE